MIKGKNVGKNWVKRHLCGPLAWTYTNIHAHLESREREGKLPEGGGHAEGQDWENEGTVGLI